MKLTVTSMVGCGFRYLEVTGGAFLSFNGAPIASLGKHLLSWENESTSP